MRKPIALTVLAVSILAASLSYAKENADEAAIRLLIADVDKAYVAQDANLMGKHLDPDYNTIKNGRITDLAQAQADLAEVRTAKLALSSKVERVRVLGDMALAQGVTSWQTTSKSDPLVVNSGGEQYTVALVKKNNVWHIFSEHFSEIPVDKKLSKQELRKVAAAFYAFDKAHEATGMARFLAKDFSLVSVNGQAKDKETFLTSVAKATTKLAAQAPGEPTFRMLEEEVALESANISFVADGNAGAAAQGKGSYNRVLQRQNSVWLIVSEYDYAIN